MKLFAFTLGALMAFGIHASFANPITFTETTTASGTLGSSDFTNAAVTVTFSGDTNDIDNNEVGNPEIRTGTATVQIAGVGTATFDDSPYVYDNQDYLGNTAVFGIAGPGGTILGVYNSDLSIYDLDASIGPVTGGAFITTDRGFTTDLGALQLKSAGTVTFTAVYNGPPAATVTLTSSRNPARVGQSVTFTSKVTGRGPTGSVLFYDGSTLLGTSALTNGTATFKTSKLSQTIHYIIAKYGGDANNGAGESGTLDQTVKK